MTQEHSITPAPELITEWIENYFGCVVTGALSDLETAIATQAAQWGADQELESCCAWVDWKCSGNNARQLREDRRSKPLSLKEQSIALLDLIQESKKPWQLEDLDVVRRALEQLPD
jgi:hypothetical protein